MIVGPLDGQCAPGGLVFGAGVEPVTPDVAAFEGVGEWFGQRGHLGLAAQRQPGEGKQDQTAVASGHDGLPREITEDFDWRQVAWRVESSPDQPARSLSYSRPHRMPRSLTITWCDPDRLAISRRMQAPARITSARRGSSPGIASRWLCVDRRRSSTMWASCATVR